MASTNLSTPGLVHHRASDQDRVCIHGRDFCCGRWDDLETDTRYRRIVAEYIATGRLPSGPGEPQSDTGLSVHELTVAFLRHAPSHYRKPDGTPTAEQDFYRSAPKPLKQLYGRTPVFTFDTVRLMAVG